MIGFWIYEPRNDPANPKSKIQKMNYTCKDYRAEMILLGLQRRLQDDDLSEAEKKKIKEQIREIEQSMGMA